jgi:hypothetical protein
MSQSYEATGRIVALLPTQQVTGTFKKREFVIEMQDGAYPQHIKFQMTQDKTAQLDSYAVGHDVKVLFNLRGKPFTKDGKTMYFTNLEAWRIEPTGTISTVSDFDNVSGFGPQDSGIIRMRDAQANAQTDAFDEVPF